MSSLPNTLKFLISFALMRSQNREVNVLRKKLVLTIFAILLAGSMLAGVFLLAPASSQVNAAQYQNKGTGALVYLNLPPAPNATSPPAPSGTSSRPSDLLLRAYDLPNSTFAGPHDALMVYLWIPQRNSYNPVALITDANDTSVYQKVWNGTFIWYNTTVASSSLFNIIKVSDQDLQIWTQNSKASGPDSDIKSHDMLVVNLTTSVNVTLPFNLWPQPSQSYGNLSFTLPPLTFTFININKNGYYSADSIAALPSGWKYQPVAEMRTPAWVEERVPLWLGTTSPLEVVGHIDWGYSQTYTPPTT